MNVSLELEDLIALGLSLKLAATVTLILLIIGVPLAWWLARTEHRLRSLADAVLTLPLILPPSVLGFYALLALAPTGPVGSAAHALGITQLAFTFHGLVITLVVSSLPFMIAPLQTAFQGTGRHAMEVAATLRANPFVAFWTVVLPSARRGIATGLTMTFAHTVGEFGVVLMIGGSIPGVTRVASVQIFDHVDSLQTGRAHGLSILLIGIALGIAVIQRLLSPRAAHS